MSVYDKWKLYVSWDGVSYQDMTSRVDGNLEIQRGRTAELNDIDPGTLTVRLDNADHQLTAGNPLSAYDVDLGKRCLVVETIGGTPYSRFAGRLTDIDPGIFIESGDRGVALTFTDRLDLLQRSPQFRSTLTAQILGSTGAPGLIGYWALDEAGGSEFKSRAGTLGNIPLAGFFASQALPLAGILDDEWLQYAGQAGPPGEDLSFPLWNPTLGTSGSAFGYVYGNLPLNLTLSAQTLTIVIWHRLDSSAAASTSQHEAYDLTGSGSTRYLLTEAGGGPTWASLISNSAGTSVAGPFTTTTKLSPDNWHMTTLQLTLPSGAVSMWRDLSYRADSTMTGAPPASVTFTNMELGRQWRGSLAHMQIYLGTAATFTYAMHCEQFRQGARGLAGQYTGERITTLAGYGGITALDIDPGVTVMSRARLAGQTLADGMGEAVTTESGDLFMRGDDTLAFRDRTARYTAAPKVTVQRAWIDEGLLPRIDGPIINSADVSLTDGPTAHVEDATSISAKGVKSGEADLHALLDFEADGRATSLVYQYKESRNRVPNLPIDLLHQTDTVRHQVLSLDIGDRADLAGMVATYPVGADKVHIEGYKELIGETVRRIEFVTSPALGQPVGNAERYFTLDDPVFGQLDSTVKLAY